MSKGHISDGYHTFDELYEHRALLFIALAKQLDGSQVWKALANADGSKWDGWFILGVFPEKGKQITYHLPMKYFDYIEATTYDVNPFFDGHTPDDVIERLKNL